MTSRINKDVAHTFANQRKCILAEIAENKNTLDPRQAKVNSDTSIIRTLRSSKKNRDMFLSIVALCAYTFKLIKSNDSVKVERAYKAKDILTACALYERNECSPAFLESIALEHRTKALKIVADSIIRAEENIIVLTETLTDLGEDSKVYEVYLKKLESVQSSLANKVTLLKLAKNM